jgi:hypothetical protein
VVSNGGECVFIRSTEAILRKKMVNGSFAMIGLACCQGSQGSWHGSLVFTCNSFAVKKILAANWPVFLAQIIKQFRHHILVKLVKLF